MMSIAWLCLLGATCPTWVPVPNQPGDSQVAPLASLQAMSLNGEGKALYRKERFAEAVEKYRAALQASPAMHAAEFNLACSLSRLGRYAESALAVESLLGRACVPWSREVMESADLAILKTSEYWPSLKKKQEAACQQWGRQLANAMFFVGRTRPPVHMKGEGVLVLSLSQEVFALNSKTGRYLQATAENGRVLAFALARDGLGLAYLTGGKLLKNPGKAPLLRALSLGLLEIPSLRTIPLQAIPGDWKRVAFALTPGGRVELELENESSVRTWMQFDGERLDKMTRPSLPTSYPRTQLTGFGVAGSQVQTPDKTCPITWYDEGGNGEVPKIRARSPRKPDFYLQAPYGAGLRGLPFPLGEPSKTERKGQE